MSTLPKLLSSIALLALTAGCSPEQPVADKYVFNGTIYTADEAQREVEAIAIKGDKILAVGTEEEVSVFVAEQTERIDLNQQFLMPGIHDSHIHPLLALEQTTCTLPDQNELDLAELVANLQSCLAEHPNVPPEGGWITVSQFNGYGADSPVFLGDYSDIATGLDEVSAQHKIILIGNDGHAYAVNHYALENAATYQGEAVVISEETLADELVAYKDLIPLNEQGQPKGQLRSQAAWDLFKYETTTVEQFIARADDINHYFLSNGITALSEAWAAERDIAVYSALAKANNLAPRVSLSYGLKKDVHVNTAGELDLDLLIQDVRVAQDELDAYDRLKIEGIKLFVDGVIEYPTQTAALFEPYKSAEIAANGDTHYDDHSDIARGYLELQPAEVNRLVNRADEEGLVMHFHAIGDRAVSLALDAIELARSERDSQLPHNISHLQLVQSGDVSRFGELGAFATPTPSWFTPWQAYDQSVIPYISQVENIYDVNDLYREDSEYMRDVYPAESIRSAGGMLSFGSDAPVDFQGPRPFTNIVGAFLRADWVAQNALDDDSEWQWVVMNPAERLSMKDVLDAYTINGAKAMRHQQETGSLEVGKQADFIIVNNDLLALAAAFDAEDESTAEPIYNACDRNYDDSYCTTEVTATYINGVKVF
ncbi:MAG: amidohydrolase family protein [Pseudomonadales bacterium]|jgi:predicted amidohydrolase YtcJ